LDFIVTLLILLALASLLFYPAMLMPILILVIVLQLSKLISRWGKFAEHTATSKSQFIISEFDIPRVAPIVLASSYDTRSETMKADVERNSEVTVNMDPAISDGLLLYGSIA
jgi:hypothetical protein